LETVLRGIAIYIFLLIVLRLSGRRTLSQMTSFDFVLLLIVAETTQQALLGDDFSITNAAVLILTLFITDILFSFVKRRWPVVTTWLDGAPTVLVAAGKIDMHAISRARVNVSDLLEAAREQHGLERLDQIKFAVLEVGGTISIVPKAKG